jgi:uncharacterized cupin superfamily protein
MAVLHDPLAAPGRRTSIYPAELSQGLDRRYKRALTELLGLTQFGINVTTLEPGGKSSHRHWHEKEDEAIYVVKGSLTLITNAGRELLSAGAIASFPAGVDDAHHLVNEGMEPATYLEFGTRSATDDITYADVDMVAVKRDGLFRFFRKSGEPYE